MKLAQKLGVPEGSWLEVNPRHIMFNVDRGPTHFVPIKNGLVYCRLAEVFTAATAIMTGEVYHKNNGRVIEMLERISASPPAWGWIWTNLGELLYGPITVFAYFDGSWRDVYTCLAIQAILMGLRALAGASKWEPIQNIQGLLWPILIGVLVPVFYYGFYDDPVRRVTL